MIKKATNIPPKPARWIDKTNNYPTALTRQTYRTNWIVALGFIASLMLNVLIVPLFLVAAFFVGRLIINYRRFKTDGTATTPLPVKSLKRLIPVYSIGFMSLAFSAFLLCACSFLFHPLGEAAAVLMILGAAWGFFGIFLGVFIYPELYKDAKVDPLFETNSMEDMLDPANPSGYNHLGSALYMHDSHKSMFSDYP